MKVPILGISPNTNIVTDKGVVEVRNSSLRYRSRELKLNLDQSSR